ncbi:hypothetical protein BJF90_01755 [Pseudonocardia sp. CNS-004]|nr:hypothetical protein BJF90_01755 [Pseudonocardia sp. CNS-004]
MVGWGAPAGGGRHRGDDLRGIPARLLAHPRRDSRESIRFSRGADQRRGDGPPQVGHVRRVSAAPIGSATIHGPHAGHRYS